MPTALDGLKFTHFTPSPKQKMVEELAHPIYAGASAGPFKCSNCEYFTKPDKCSHPEIIKLRKGVVEPEACCDYFNKG